MSFSSFAESEMGFSEQGKGASQASDLLNPTGDDGKIDVASLQRHIESLKNFSLSNFSTSTRFDGLMYYNY